MFLIFILVCVGAYLLYRQIPAVRIRRLMTKGKKSYYDLYAATITRKFGNPYRSGALEVRYSSGEHHEDTEIFWNGTNVFELRLIRAEVTWAETAVSKKVKGYIPGQWEQIITSLYDTIRREEKERDKKRNTPSRERFGV